MYIQTVLLLNSAVDVVREKETKTERANMSWRREEKKEMRCENETEKENCEKRRRREGVKKATTRDGWADGGLTEGLTEG